MTHAYRVVGTVLAIFCLGGCSALSTTMLDSSPRTDGSVILAASVSESDVQAAVFEAQSGQTVVVPPGTGIWSTPIYIEKGITLQGSGMGQTKIYDPHTQLFDALIVVEANENQAFRIMGFTFSGMQGDFTDHSDAIIINGNTSQFRIDHNIFTDGGAHSIYIDGAAYGVIDHNKFINASQEVVSINDEGTGDDSWNRPLVFGSAEAVYVETNHFDFETKGDHAITGVNGARYVFRHNTVDSTALLNANQVDVHGNYFNDRGTRSFEIYGNVLESQGSYQGMYIRGGSGVIFNNTFTGDYTHPIIFTQYRAFEPDSSTSCGYVNCTYPTPDQIHDVYVWNNTYNGASAPPLIDDRGLVQQMIQLGRDYFLEPMPAYSPYPYPHPLTVSGQLAAAPVSSSSQEQSAAQ